MRQAIDTVAIGHQLKVAIVGRKITFGKTINGFLVFQAVTDQVLDGADFKIMFLGEFFQIRTARHGAVFIEDFHDHGAGVETGKAGEVAAGFGMTGAGEHATGLGHQRKDMAGLDNVTG